MNLDTAFNLIEAYLGLKADTLKAYAEEDRHGGYHSDPAQATMPIGSIWGVEGQVLYALTRHLQPNLVVELGTYWGGSTTHFAAALAANKHGRIASVDAQTEQVTGNDVGSIVPESLRHRVDFVEATGVTFLRLTTPASIDILFEDMLHDAPTVAEVWALAQSKVRPGGLVISHDAAHFLVGADVLRGIHLGGVSEPLVLLIEPSDTGLALWRVPGGQVEPVRFVEPGQEELEMSNPIPPGGADRRPADDPSRWREAPEGTPPQPMENTEGATEDTNEETAPEAPAKTERSTRTSGTTRKSGTSSTRKSGGKGGRSKK